MDGSRYLTRGLICVPMFPKTSSTTRNPGGAAGAGTVSGGAFRDLNERCDRGRLHRRTLSGMQRIFTFVMILVIAFTAVVLLYGSST